MNPAPSMSTSPYFRLTFPFTRANLTHYYVMRLDGNCVTFGDAELTRRIGQHTWVVIGEAEMVRKIGRGRWEARLVQWGVDRKQKRLDPAKAQELGWREIRGPWFALFPKEEFGERPG